MLRKVAALLLAPLVLAGVAFWGSSAASAADAHAGSFVSKANAERTSRGMRAYTLASDLSAVARRHAQRMASQKRLYHNPGLGSEVSGWQVVGENVGMGGDVASIHRAFMNSPEHRANILARDFTEIGIGTVVDADGVMWVTQVFRLPFKAVAPAPAKPRVVVAARSKAAPVTRPAAPARPVTKPAPAKKAVAAPAPVAVDAGALVGALAEATTVDPMAQAMAYADAMAAFGR